MIIIMTIMMMIMIILTERLSTSTGSKRFTQSLARRRHGAQRFCSTSLSLSLQQRTFHEPERSSTHLYFIVCDRGDGLAQWLELLGWRSKSREFESFQEHKKNFEFFKVKKVSADSLSVCPTPVCIRRAHTKDHVRTLKIL